MNFYPLEVFIPVIMVFILKMKYIHIYCVHAKKLRDFLERFLQGWLAHPYLKWIKNFTR
jgi:hypothetical protein